MDFDVSLVLSRVNAWLAVIVASAETYFTSLDQLELIGWAGVGLGLILVIMALILL